MVNQGALVIASPQNLLILGGSTEASALARAVAEAGVQATFSYAGRVTKLIEQPVPVRVGGFGGVNGLIEHLRLEEVTHVVDATHPFAAGMSGNAVQACTQTDVPLIALTRPPWVAAQGDDWRVVPNVEAAVAALDRPRQNVFLAIGRQNLASFAAQPQHRYLLRLVEAPAEPPALPDHIVTVARGPFAKEADRALMKEHQIDIVVCKNSGGTAARAKLEAARALGLPVMMIDRPEMPKRDEAHSVEEVMRWLHAGTDLGV